MSSITEAKSWTNMLEEESLYVCSCDVDVNNFSISTNYSSSSSLSSGGSSEVTEIEECALTIAPTPRPNEAQSVEERHERTKPPQESKVFTGSNIVPEERVKKTRELANIGHVRAEFERIIKKLDKSAGRLCETSDNSALMPMKITGRGPNEVEVEWYLSKGPGHSSTYEGDDLEKLNLSHPKLPSNALFLLEDAISQQSSSSDSINRLMLKRKKDTIKEGKIDVGKLSAIKKDDPLVPKSEALEMGKNECHQSGMNSSSLPNPMKYVELGEEFADPFKKCADLSTNACENHVPNPTSTRATELTRDYEIIVRESSHKQRRYFVCLMDKKQCVAMEKLPNAKQRNNPKSILNRNSELLSAGLHSVELGKKYEGNIVDEIHAFHQKGPFTDKITTCFECPIEEASQANHGFLETSQSSQPLEGELQQISDSVSKYPSSIGKGKSEDKTNGNSKEPFCTLIEISDDSVAFLPELPVESVRVSPPDRKYFRSGSAESLAGKSCLADVLKIYENTTQIPECIISYENSDVVDAQGWHPSICSIPNTEKNLVETCAEFSHDFCGIHVKVTEPQGVDVVVQSHLLNIFESSDYLRVLQPFCNVRAKSFKCSADFSRDEINRRCAIETLISSSSTELSGLLQGGDTVREERIELSSKNHCQNTATASHLAEMKQCVAKKSIISPKGPEFSFHCTSRDSDGFGDVEDDLKESEKHSTKANHTYHVLGASFPVDDVQALSNDSDENCDSNTTQAVHPGKIQFINSTSDYAVTLADPPNENVEVLETASPITELEDAFKIKKNTVLPTALKFSRNLNRICQKVLTTEGEVVEITDLRDEKLQTNSTIPPLPLVDILPKPAIHVNQMIAYFFDETVDTLCFLNLTAANESIVMPQSMFQKVEKTARNEPQTMFPELVLVIPLQEMPEFINNYKLFHGVQERPKNASKTKGVKSSSLISTTTRDGLTECTESEETNPVVVDDDPPAQSAANELEHLDRLADYSFKLEHLSAAKKSMQNPNSEESDFLLCWGGAPPTSRRKYYQLNSMRAFSRNQFKHILPHDRHVVSRLKERRQFPSATFKNPPGGRGGRANICGEHVQPLVLMGGFEPDSVCTIATPNNEYLGQIHSAFHMRQKVRLNSNKRETFSTRQRSRKETVRIASPSTKQGPETRRNCKNPLDLLILDTISSISEHNTLDSNGNASSDMQLLLQSERHKSLASLWWKKYRLNS